MPDVQEIVNQSILQSGGERYENSLIQFNFRDRKYTVKQDKGGTEMTRTTYEDSIEVIDQVKNGKFQRLINKKLVEVIDSMAIKYVESINSVIYFALLPYRLNDAAVNKDYLGLKSINNMKYHKVKVTFEEEGGGIDFQDVYVYWINMESNKVDYLAYSFKVDGGGYRFRAAYNERYIGGIRFVDYINYKPKVAPKSLEKLDDFFINGELKELSKIELRNISVSQ